MKKIFAVVLGIMLMFNCTFGFAEVNVKEESIDL